MKKELSNILICIRLQTNTRITAYHCLLLILSLFLFFVEKVLFHWTDVLSDIAFAHQLLKVGPDDIQEDWKPEWFSNETTNPWRNEAATVLNPFLRTF